MKVINFRNCISLKNKRIFPLPMVWFIFNLQGRKNNQTNIHDITRIYDFSCYATSLNMFLLELMGVWLVLVQTGPLCLHAHSIPIFVSPLLLVILFIDAFTVFPTRTANLGHPSLNIGAAGFSFGFNCIFTLIQTCGEQISLHSHHVSLVQWTNTLLPITRDLGSNPLGGT